MRIILCDGISFCVCGMSGYVRAIWVNFGLCVVSVRVYSDRGRFIMEIDVFDGYIYVSVSFPMYLFSEYVDRVKGIVSSFYGGRVSSLGGYSGFLVRFSYDVGGEYSNIEHMVRVIDLLIEMLSDSVVRESVNVTYSRMDCGGVGVGVDACVIRFLRMLRGRLESGYVPMFISVGSVGHRGGGGLSRDVMFCRLDGTVVEYSVHVDYGLNLGGDIRDIVLDVLGGVKARYSDVYFYGDGDGGDCCGLYFVKRGDVKLFLRDVYSGVFDGIVNLLSGSGFELFKFDFSSFSYDEMFDRVGYVMGGMKEYIDVVGGFEGVVDIGKLVSGGSSSFVNFLGYVKKRGVISGII